MGLVSSVGTYFPNVDHFRDTFLVIYVQVRPLKRERTLTFVSSEGIGCGG